MLKSSTPQRSMMLRELLKTQTGLAPLFQFVPKTGGQIVKVPLPVLTTVVNMAIAILSNVGQVSPGSHQVQRFCCPWMLQTGSWHSCLNSIIIPGVIPEVLDTVMLLVESE